MKYFLKYLLYFMPVAAMYSCKKPYTPPAITSPASYLVVEGVINAGADSTIIKLSHTVNLSTVSATNPQAKAIVTVESDQNSSYPLTETTPGCYVSPGLNLDNTRQYRLRIKTPDNQQYLSAFVAVKVTPPIDSIGFTATNNGLQIYANAHDVNNNTRYYRWDYAETWAFHAEYESTYITNGTAIVKRQLNQLVYSCFAGDVSSTINIASTAALSQDVVYQAPITQIPSTSEKVETRYSILLRQYALTADAYNFWKNLKTNTEQLGSIFDAQPSTSAGNIHNVNNPAELVVGYISACTVQTKRIFISNSQLPHTWITTYPYNCSLDSDYYIDPKPPHTPEVADFLIPLVNNQSIPISSFDNSGGGYIAASIDCIDCTIRGTTITPPFW